MRRIRVLGDNGLTRLVRMPSTSGGRVFVYRLWIGPQPDDVLPLSPAAAAEWMRDNREGGQTRNFAAVAKRVSRPAGGAGKRGECVTMTRARPPPSAAT